MQVKAEEGDFLQSWRMLSERWRLNKKAGKRAGQIKQKKKLVDREIEHTLC